MRCIQRGTGGNIYQLGQLVFLTSALLGMHAAAQTVLTNGAETAGSLLASSTNTYVFNATNGNALILRIGAPLINPRMILYGPGHVEIAFIGSGAAGARDDYFSLQATNTGQFTVEVSSIFNTAGSYLLNLAQIPGDFVVSPGDEGGPMTNGWKYTGTNDIGDLDMWSFTANAGDSIIVRMGANTFNPWIRLYGPTGILVGSAGSGIAGALMADLSIAATNSGTYTVVTSSLTGDGAGSYVVNLAQAPEPVFVAPGDNGGPLTNGWKHSGNLALGELDVWTFDANAGDNVILRMGSTNYNPWIRVYGPSGSSVGSAGSGIAGTLNVELAFSATNAGSYTVVASSFTGDGVGNYLLNLAKAPGTVFVAPGDDGGDMTNGWKYTPTLELGDLDVWTFSANTGDTLLLRMAAQTFNPWIRLFGPSGGLVAQVGNGVSGNLDVNLSVQATNTGTFTVVASSFSGNGVGSYLINLARIPGVFVVSPNDEGGSLISGVNQVGTIDPGDMDIWRFAGCHSQPIVLSCQKLTGANFTPRIRLYSRTGALLATAANTNLATISYASTNSGLFTAVVDGANVNDSGTYQLSGNGVSDELTMCLPLIFGTNLGYGGGGRRVQLEFHFIHGNECKHACSPVVAHSDESIRRIRCFRVHQQFQRGGTAPLLPGAGAVTQSELRS